MARVILEVAEGGVTPVAPKTTEVELVDVRDVPTMAAGDVVSLLTTLLDADTIASRSLAARVLQAWSDSRTAGA